MNQNPFSVTKAFCVCVLFICMTGSAQSAHGFRHQHEYCSLLARCGIELKYKDCHDSLKTGIKGVAYNAVRCNEARQLEKAGIKTDDYLGRKLYGFLGQRYRVDYPIHDNLPIKTSWLEYLVSDIPLAAKMVNAFQDTKYSVEYLDGDRKRYWRGSNGRNLSGEANLIAGSLDSNHLIYFGFGIVKVLKWKLKGDVLFEFKYKDGTSEGQIPYDLKIIVFPGGAIVNAIMNMGLFKKVVRNKILEVFKHITDSGQELAKLSFEEILKKADWTEAEKVKLKELMALR